MSDHSVKCPFPHLPSDSYLSTYLSGGLQDWYEILHIVVCTSDHIFYKLYRGIM